MNKEEIEKILNDTRLDISNMTKTTYNQMIRMILEQGMSPQEAQKQIKEALASVNEDATGIIASSLSTALGRQFSASYVKNFEVNGVKLSKRLYNNSKDVAGATQKVINQAIKENKTIAEVSKLLYEGYDFKLDPLNVKKNKTIPKWLKEELNKEPSQRSFKQVSDIKTPALRAAYTDVLKTKTFQEQEKALKRAFYEKSRYYADRIAQNEIMKSYSVERAKMLKEDNEIEVVRVALSRSHPRKDICDYHTSVNKYGLGKGVYPKDKAPVPPFHPFCRCRIIEKITLSAKDAKFNPKADKDFMDTLGKYKRSLIVGSNRRLDMFYKNGNVMKSAYLGNPIYIKDIGSVKALGYNGEMEKLYLSDSGQEKRYNKALSMNDSDVDNAIKSTQRHIFFKKQKKLEYEKYKIHRANIISSTNNKREKAIIFNDDGVVFDKLGLFDKVKFTDEEMKKIKGNYLIHNHPSGKSLSFQDVKLAIYSGAKEIVAIGKSSVMYRFTIRKPIDINEVVVKYKEATRKTTEVMRKLYKNNIVSKEIGIIEFEHMVMSLFSDSIKGASYEQTKYR